jgi:hypothetical protein
MACAVAGCSVTTQLGSVFGRDKPEGTASIPSQPPLADPAALPDATDLTAVRTAAAAMLDAGETGTQWEKSGDRRPRHHHPDRVELQPGWHAVPRLPRELRP